MKNKTKTIVGIVVLIVLVLVISLVLYLKKGQKENEKVSTIKDIDTKVDLDNGDEKINWDSLDSSELSLDNKSLIIDKEGIYTLSGDIKNGNIIVNTDGDVKLILNNVNIKSDDSPAIIIESANNTVIELQENSINTLEDGTEYSNTEYDGCIFSRDDLIFQGTGTLNIKSNYLDGIVSNDDLKIIDGVYHIESNDDGIRGKDSVYIINGQFNINSKSDGIKSTNDTETEKGYINIENGTFDIETGEDGFQAETKLIIYNGIYNIKTSSGSNSQDSAIYHDFYNGKNYDSTSTKALKSGDNLVIKNGTFKIDSKDDAIHSNNYVGIENGMINISSGDDGIHADNEIIIENGTIDITKSYEGIEANDITISGGTISIVSNDDGINVSGGNDSSSIGGRPGANHMSSSSGTLTITGGNIYVNASGDGLDANGNIIISGGITYVDGPTNSGNGSLDYDTSCDLNGGTFIAVGSSGMAQGISSSSKQYSLMFYLSSNYNQEITVLDEDGNEIISYTPSKPYSSIVISNNKIKKDETYTLKIDGQKITTLTATTINSSNRKNNMNQGHGGGPGGGRR